MIEKGVEFSGGGGREEGGGGSGIRPHYRTRLGPLWERSAMPSAARFCEIQQSTARTSLGPLSVALCYAFCDIRRPYKTRLEPLDQFTLRKHQFGVKRRNPSICFEAFKN